MLVSAQWKKVDLHQALQHPVFQLSCPPLPHAEDKLPDQCHHQGLVSQVNLECVYQVLVSDTSVSLTFCPGAVFLCLKEMVGIIYGLFSCWKKVPTSVFTMYSCEKRLTSAFKVAILPACFDFSFGV